MVWRATVTAIKLASSLILAAGTSALAGSDATPSVSQPDTEAQVFLVCPASEPEFCKALSKALQDRAAPRPVTTLHETSDLPETAQAILHFILTTRTADTLSGHLTWSGSDMPSGTGPDVELSVMDSTLTDAMITNFAMQIVKTANIPL